MSGADGWDLKTRGSLSIIGFLRMILSSVWLVLLMIACDMPTDCDAVSLPFVFETTNGEDQYWKVTVKPRSSDEVSIVTNKKPKSGLTETLIILSKTSPCPACAEAVRDGLSSQELRLHVVPLEGKLSFRFLSSGLSANSVLDGQEILGVENIPPMPAASQTATPIAVSPLKPPATPIAASPIEPPITPLEATM